MTPTAYRGIVSGGVILLEEKAPLTEGTPVLVTPLSGARGSGAAIAAALKAAPKVPIDWVDELEQLIAEGRRPPAPPALFGGATGEQESR